MNLEKIKSDIEKIVNDNNLILKSVDYIKRDDLKILEVVIDKLGFVDINDVENVTRPINEYLDKTDPIDEEYSLEVTSLGVEKEFKFDDSSYYLNKKIEVKTMDQVFVGTLLKVESDNIEIKNIKNKNIKINANDIESLRIVI